MNNDVITNENVQAPAPFAGFWWRLLAYLIDNIIVSMASWIIILPVLGVFGISIWSLSESGYDLEDPRVILGPIFMLYGVIISVTIVINWLYYALMESSKTQGTVGKLALKIKVTDYDYKRISFARASGRYFGKIISSFIFMIGYIMIGFTEKKQGLHDIMANCYVIKE